MRGFNDPEDLERTVAQTGDIEETVSLGGDEDGSITAPRPRPRSEEPKTIVARTGPPPPLVGPPPFPRRSNRPPPLPPFQGLAPAGSHETPAADLHETPLLQSRVEHFPGPDAERSAPSALEPFSKGRRPAPAPLARDTPTLKRPQSASTKPPGWVIGYLVLCAALSLVGLVVLYFEHRILGGAR